MPTTAAIRQRLIVRRHQLLIRYRDELARVEDELATRRRGSAKDAPEDPDGKLLGVLGNTDMRAIMAVLEALDRLDHGHYGKCTGCGGPISVARLELLPESAICIDCANAAEPLMARSA